MFRANIRGDDGMLEFSSGENQIKLFKSEARGVMFRSDVIDYGQIIVAQIFHHMPLVAFETANNFGPMNKGTIWYHGLFMARLRDLDYRANGHAGVLKPTGELLAGMSFTAAICALNQKSTTLAP